MRVRQTETVIAIDSRGHFYVNADPVREGDLVSSARRARENATNKAVVVTGDQDAPYLAIMRATDALGARDTEDVALVTAPPPRRR
jgi:biopolymer transport protein ExbD